MLFKKYVNHSRNGLYVVSGFPTKELEYVSDIEDVSREDIEERIPCYTSDDKKLLCRRFRDFFRKLCEDNVYIHINGQREIYLRKFFSKRYRWDGNDKTDIFLKLCERMYNKTEYSFVISIKRKDGRDIIETFQDTGYLDFIRNQTDSYLQVKVDNINCFDAESWSLKVEEMFYQVEDFGERLIRLIDNFLETPGMLFKKIKNGVPFGLWLVGQLIDNVDDNDRIIITKEKLGLLFFQSRSVFCP